MFKFNMWQFFNHIAGSPNDRRTMLKDSPTPLSDDALRSPSSPAIIILWS